MDQKDYYDLISNSEALAFLGKEGENVASYIIEKNSNFRPLLLDKCLDDMKKAYKSRMVSLFMRLTGEVLLKQMSMIDPIGSTDPMKTDKNVVFQAMDKTVKIIGSSGDYYLNNYPLVSEFKEIMQRNFIESQIEFLNNFLKAKGELEKRFFAGKEITQITSLSGGAGDSHRHGRSVCGIATNVGNVFYKPHDCKLDILYHTLVKELFSDFTDAADCVCGDGFGFVTELKAKAVEKKEDIDLYYRNFGKLLSLFHGIGAMDMHLENILPCGQKPCAIDLETMFKPETRQPLKNGARRLAKSKYNERTVMRTAVLPFYLHEIGTLSPLYRTKFFDDVYLPECGGRFTVEGYEKCFIDGFNDGYDYVKKNRDRIKALFSSSEECELRILLRNSEYYDVMRRSLWTSKSLSDRAEQRRVLDRLQVPFKRENVDINEAIVRYEEKCLLEGDIPYYCAQVGGRDLFGSSFSEAIERNYFEKSAWQKSFEDLDRLSDGDKLFESDIIRNSFRQAVTDVGAHDFEIERDIGKGELEPKLKALVENTMAEIYNSRIRMPDGNLMFSPYTPIMHLKYPCSDVVYALDAGVFSAMAKSKGFSPNDYLIENSISRTNEKILEWTKEDELYLRSSLKLDFAGGVAGLAMRLDKMAALNVSGSRDAFFALLDLIDQKGLYLVDDKNNAKYLPELVIALALSKCDSSKKAEIIEKSARRLFECYSPGKSDPLSLSEAALAFCLSYKITKDKRYLKASDEAFFKLNGMFDDKICGWKEEGSIYNWIPKSSPNAPFIGLLASKAAAQTDRARQTVELAAKSVMNEKPLRDLDSLHYGNALSALFLKSAADCLERPELNERAKEIILLALERKKEAGEFRVCRPGMRDFFDVSLAFGVPGIGAVAMQFL